ncbi:MAG: hypothetical protein KOO61_00720 [Spirochaetales bacterium]|nr:hypothetical protein [Spirochaetales bacterium]
MTIRPILCGFMVLALAAPVSLVAQEALESAQQDEPEIRTSPILNEQTLRRDIETAGFYELIAWLEGLNQSTAGDRNALAGRLLGYYGLAEEPILEDESTPLVIDSATRTRYFTLDEIDESYVRLSGGVTLTLRDDERDVTHQIVADEVTYNQDLNVLSASGDVIYILDRGGTIERFTGAALTVQLDDWDGAFVHGVTERARTIEGEEVDFSFAGSYITRSSDDVVVMEDGRVTSSTAKPPNYEIHADKIWVLSPGEWGLRNAYLYVGRVAIFYFPFFFRPGNEFFFNPSVGVRDREGRFIQTTTYILGEPEEPESAFSFLQIAEEEGAGGEHKIEGLYLVPDEESDLAPEDSGAVLRILTDIYTKLGAYVAIDGTIPESGVLNNLEVYLGLGMSRHIYPGQGSTYTPYHLMDGEAVTSWNATQIGSVRVPFRFGLGLSAALRGQGYTVSGDVTLFSDSRFQKDFDRRTEQIDWLGLMGQGTPVPEPGLVTSYEWALRGSLTPQVQALNPWLQRVQLQNASIVLRWREESLPEPSEEEGYQTPQEELVWEADGSPETGFFYPDTLQLPNVSGIISGQILRLSSSSAPDGDLESPPESDLRPPWTAESFEPLGPEEYLRLPAPPGAMPPPPIPELWNASVGYTFTPSGLLENTFNSAGWEEAADVDYSLEYSAASGRVGGTLPMALNLLSNAIGLTGSLAMSGQYRTVYNRAGTMEDVAWTSLLQQAYSYSSANATGNMALRVSPFTGSRLWSSSTVSYSLNLLLYQFRYEPLDPAELEALGIEGLEETGPPTHTEWIDWGDESFVRSHQVQLNAVLDVLSGQAVRLTADLPPRALRFVGQLDFGLSPVAISVASGLLQEEDAAGVKSWAYQPITSAQALLLGELGQIQNQISYDWDQDNGAYKFAYNNASATIGPVGAQFEWRSAEEFKFESAGEDWDNDGIAGERWISVSALDDQGNPILQPLPTRAAVTVNLSSELEPMWRSRLLLGGTLTSSWSMNLLRYTESSLSFGLKTNVEITDFLSLSFSSQSMNTQSYVYVESLAEGVGRERRSLVVDLLKSFNFFSTDQKHRTDSAFNLQQIQVNATHNLEDWDLEISYSGRPEIIEVLNLETPEADDTRRVYDWQSSLEIVLQWRAIRELSSNLQADNRTGSDAVTTGSPWDLTFGSDS